MHIRKLIILAVLSLGLTTAANEKFKRKIEIGTKAKLNLSNCNIVVPQEASKVAAFAAKELQRYLEKSLGSKIKIVKTPAKW